jgi:hypothetical protein
MSINNEKVTCSNSLVVNHLVKQNFLKITKETNAMGNTKLTMAIDLKTSNTPTATNCKSVKMFRLYNRIFQYHALLTIFKKASKVVKNI